MSNVNYSQMSDEELKLYFLKHREDQSAFEAYLDRIHQKPRPTIISKEELKQLSFGEKMKLISERLQARFGSQLG